MENISQDVFAFFCTDMCVFAKIRCSRYNANTVCVGVVGVGLIENISQDVFAFFAQICVYLQRHDIHGTMQI